MNVKLTSKGNWKETRGFLKSVKKFNLEKTLNKYGELGVRALEQATPKNTGLTASSWSYEIFITDKSSKIVWSNSNSVEKYDYPIALLIQYGHATKDGGYIEGIDYINPAMKSIFDKLAIEAWEEVIKGAHSR